MSVTNPVPLQRVILRVINLGSGARAVNLGALERVTYLGALIMTHVGTLAHITNVGDL